MDGSLLDIGIFLLATFAGALVAGVTGFAFGLVVAALWLHILRNTSRNDSDDANFLRWLEGKCATEPQLIDRIRDSVDASGLWPQ